MAREIFSSGFEAGGVTTAGVFEEDGHIYCTEVMPGNVVQSILDEIHYRREHAPPHPKGSGFHWIGSVPNTLIYKWKVEWRATSKKDGVEFVDFVAARLNSPDFKALRGTSKI